ncbi:MAG TPA: PspC domain-containing protein [Prolixibacteraceae bacterium]|nr:PspC domain-containing protein [Prolixibacteraceae bacterium]
MELNSPKRLTRSRKDRMLAGICGGIADYMAVDPTVVRLIFALATFFTVLFPGVLIYLIMWIVVPKEREF